VDDSGKLEFQVTTTQPEIYESQTGYSYCAISSPSDNNGLSGGLILSWGFAHNDQEVIVLWVPPSGTTNETMMFEWLNKQGNFKYRVQVNRTHGVSVVLDVARELWDHLIESGWATYAIWKHKKATTT
jgi:hypothetical protein